MIRRLPALALVVPLLAALAPNPAPGVMPLRPFGSQPQAYAAGTIRPNHLAQAVLDRQVQAAYDAWKARSLRPGCGAGGYVVLAGDDGTALAGAEAHARAMLLVVLMAGHDADAQAIFAGLHAVYRAHPSVHHGDLMSARQAAGCGVPRGEGSATGADLDMALALLLADKQWGGCEAIDYRAEALRIIAGIAAADRHPSGALLWLGSWVGGAGERLQGATRSADVAPAHLRSFARAAEDASWLRLLDAGYALIDTMQTHWAPGTGLVPDLVENALLRPMPATAALLGNVDDGSYGRDACRMPWRLGLDAVLHGEPRARTALARLTAGMRERSGGDPSRVASGYRLNGTVIPGAEMSSLACLAPLGVAALTDHGNQAWLNAVWDAVVTLPPGDEADDSLRVLAMLVMAGHWWAPEAVPGTMCGAPAAPTRATSTAWGRPPATTAPRTAAATRTPVAVRTTPVPTRTPTPRAAIGWSAVRR